MLDVFIDSKCRDMTKYITPSQYSILFEKELSNIVSVELVHAIYGKGNTNDIYTNMHIEELNMNGVLSHVKACCKAFTQLTFSNPINEHREQH